MANPRSGLDMLRQRLSEGPDLSRFAVLNERKAGFAQRQATVREIFPDAAALMAPESPESEEAWSRSFDRDPELMGRILRDILKSEQIVAGKPGPRPGLDPSRAAPTLDRWMGKDYAQRPYSVLSFAESLTILAGDLSMTQLARKVGLDRNLVWRLARGKRVPSRQMIEQVAAAFKKQPSWFLEYRIGTVASIIVNQLMANPESSIRGYETMFNLGVAGNG